jgi:hypothetical protein
LTYAFKFDRTIVNDSLEHALEETATTVDEFLKG